MSRKPIPQKLRDEFIGYVSAYDDDDLPDGAWFAIIEDQCREFMFIHKLRGDANDAAFQLLELKGATHE